MWEGLREKGDVEFAPKGKQQLDDQKSVKGNPRFWGKSTSQGGDECSSQPDWEAGGVGEDSSRSIQATETQEFAVRGRGPVIFLSRGKRVDSGI